MKAIMIPSIDSAIYLKKKLNIYKNFIICTNSPSVYIYCIFYLKINCVDINDFFSDRKKNNILKVILRKYLKKLNQIDKKLNLILNSKNNSKFRNWLFTLYRYSPFLYYLGLYSYHQSLKNFIKKKRVKELTVINDYKSISDFFDSRDIVKINKSINTINVKIIEINKEFSKSKNKFVLYKIYLKKSVKKIISIFKKNYFTLINLFNNKKRNIIVLQPLYELKKIDFSNYNLYSFPEVEKDFFKKKTFNSNNKIFNNKKFPVIKNSNDICLQIILRIIKNHFTENFIKFNKFINKSEKFIKKYKPLKAYWGLPPIQPNEKVLMVKQLMNNKIKVIGAQHGGSYGDQDQDNLHSLSDYLFCNEFRSYNNFKLNLDKKIFLKKDLCKFHPVGSNKLQNLYRSGGFIKKNYKTILFPVSNWTDNFDHNMGISTSQVLSRQKIIFKSLKDYKLKTIVKLKQNVTDHYAETCYPGYYLAKNYENKNIKIEESMNFQEAINFYKPNLVILEVFSTPLYECVVNNCDIICFLDHDNKLKKHVEKKLSKRIHFVKKNNQFDSLIKQYYLGKLKKKRDNSFLKENLLNLS